MKTAGLFRKLLLFLAFILARQAFAQEEIQPESNNIRIDPEWIKQFSTGDFSTVSDVKTDRDGNIYQTGYFSQYLQMGSQSVDPKCKTGDCRNYFFLSKHDSQGKLLWIRYAVGTARSVGLAFDRKGDVYLAGNVWSKTLRFTSEDTTTVMLDKPNDYNAGFFSCKYKPDGKVLESRFYKSSRPQSISGFFLDNKDNFYAAGSYQYRSYRQRSETKNSFLLSKFNRKGKLRWQLQGDTASLSGISSVYVHKGKDVFITGSFQKELKIGSRRLKNTYSEGKIFVARLDSKGNLKWATDSLGKAYGSFGKTIACDQKGNPYVLGVVPGSNLLLAGFDKLGNLQWAHTSKGHSQYPQQMLIVEDNIYLCGQGYSTEFGSTGPNKYAYKTESNLDVFLAGYSTTGELRWLKAGGGRGTSYCSAMAVHTNSLIAAGSHNDLFQFQDSTLEVTHNYPLWLAKFDLKKLEFIDTSPQRPPKPDKFAVTVDPTTCTCTKPQIKAEFYPGRIKDMLSYKDFVSATGWQSLGSDSLYTDLFYYNFSSTVNYDDVAYSFTLVAFEPVRLLYPDRNFGLNFTPCQSNDVSLDLPMYIGFNKPMWNYRPDFDYKTFDHSARSWFEILGEVAQMPDSEILLRLLKYRSETELRKIIAAVNKKYRISIKIDPEDEDATAQNILTALERKNIEAGNFILQEFIQTSPRSSGKVNATEARRLAELFGERFQYQTLAEIERTFLRTQIRAGFEAKQVGFEVSDKIIRRWDSIKKQAAINSQGKTEATTILLDTPEISYTNEKGLEAEIKSVCLTPTEITGTGILLHFSQAEMIASDYQQFNRLPYYHHPLFITDSTVYRSHEIPHQYNYTYDTLIMKFTGLYVPEATFEIPFKGQVLNVKGLKLLLNNNLLSGTLEIPVIPQPLVQKGKVKIKVGAQEETVTLQELKANFVRIGLKQVKLVQEPEKVLVYFRKGLN